MPPSPTPIKGNNAMATDVGGLSPDVRDHQAPISAGHNRGPKLFVDPGVCKHFIDCGPISLRTERIDSEHLKEFEAAIRSQGPEKIRQAAISNLLARSRANRDLSHQEYRILEGIASRCRWAYRYHCETLEALAWFTAAPPGNMRRPIEALTSLRLVARLNVPRRTGGRPIVYLTVICTAEDRSGQSVADLAQAAKLRGLSCESNHPDEGLQTVIAMVSPTDQTPSNLHSDGLQTIMAKGANHHHEEHTVNLTVESGLKKEVCPRPHKEGAADTPSFEAFWEAFPGPRKRAKAEAAKLFRKIVSGRHPGGHRATADELIDAARAYAASLPPSDLEFAPMPITWLNKARWLDPIPSKPLNKFDATKVRRG